MDKIAFSGNNDQQTKFRVAVNDGRCTATQVRLTLSVSYYDQFYDSFSEWKYNIIEAWKAQPTAIITELTRFRDPFCKHSATVKPSDRFNGIIHEAKEEQLPLQVTELDADRKQHDTLIH